MHAGMTGAARVIILRSVPKHDKHGGVAVLELPCKEAAAIERSRCCYKRTRRSSLPEASLLPSAFHDNLFTQPSWPCSSFSLHSRLAAAGVKWSCCKSAYACSSTVEAVEIVLRGSLLRLS